MRWLVKFVIMHRVSATGSGPKRSVGVAGLVALLGLFLALMSPGPGTATAEAPTRLPTYVVDSADAITAAERTDLEAAVDSLYNAHGVQMWIVYVRDFGGLTSEQWADQTALASELGDHDALLAVATEDRAYRLFAPDSIGGLDQSTLDEVANDDVVPQLREANWAGAGFAAVNGLSDALDPSYTGSSSPGWSGAPRCSEVAARSCIHAAASSVASREVRERCANRS